jgi:hypothetical protein
VRGSNGASWNKHRLDGISVTLKVVADALQGKGLSQSVSSNSVCLVEQRPLSLHSRYLALLDHREDSSNVLSHNPTGPDCVDAAEHIRPEVAVILRASPLPGVTERLAGKAPCEHVDLSPPFGEVCCCDVFIRFCIWVPIIQHRTPEGVNLAVEEVFPPEHGCGHLRAADAAEY